MVSVVQTFGEGAKFTACPRALLPVRLDRFGGVDPATVCGREFEALVRYRMRPAVSLSRLHFTPGSHEVVYLPKGGHDGPEPTESERIDAMEFVARVLVPIPDPRRHLVRSYGACSNAARGQRKKSATPAEPSSLVAISGQFRLRSATAPVRRR
jgi:hypothetical protein